MKMFYGRLFLLSFFIFTNESQAQENKIDFKEFSYAYGYRFAKSLEEKENFDAAERDSKQIIKGMKAGLKPDSLTLANITTFVEKRLKEEDYKVTKENGKKMAFDLGYLSVGNMIFTFKLPTSDFHYPSLKKGFLDFAKGKNPKLKEEQMEQIITTYFQQVQEKLAKEEQVKKEALAKENAKKSTEFLAQNSKKEGVVTTPSGLQYLILQQGTGAKPTLKDVVKVHYHGTLIDGKVFDSSVDAGKPISFPLTNLIKGWQEGIPFMAVGAKYRFFIPADLAYGDNAPPSIGPSQTLIFDIELLEIKANKPSNPKTDLSYSYGYMVGKSLSSVSLTEKETNTKQFVAGIAKGFEANQNDLANAEKLLRARIQENKASVTEEAANAIAFSIGYTSSASMSQQLGAKLLDFDINKLGEGYDLAKKGEEPRLTMDEMNKVLQAYFEPKQKALQAQQDKQNESVALKQIEEGAKFLAENGKKEGVITLPSGLQYEIMKEGTGEKPTLQSTVKTHYHGTLINGTIFDSSVDRGQPASFPVSGVIKGWTEALQLMKVGSKYRLFVPYNLAYGTRAMGAKIPAGSTLIFEVELLEIVK